MASPYADYVISNIIPIIYWELQEDIGSITAIDSMGFDSGAYSGTAITLESGSLIPSEPTRRSMYVDVSCHDSSNCSGYAWDGSFQNIVVTFDLITVGVCFKTSYIESLKETPIFGFRDLSFYSGNPFLVIMDTSGYIKVKRYAEKLGGGYESKEHTFNVAGSIADGNPHHIIVSYSLAIDTLTLYLDGVAYSTVTDGYAAIPNTQNDETTVGADYFFTWDPNGGTMTAYLSDFFYANKYLSLVEAEDLHDQWLNGAPITTGIRITGFKTRTLSEITIQGQTYHIPFEWDSNDIAAYIRTKLISSGDFGANVGILSEVTRARAQVNFDLSFAARIFDNSIPSLTLTQDGTTLWSHTPPGDVSSSTIPLLAVEGIYAARGRLGYWDRSNLLGWSSYNVPSDFVPSSTTRANQKSIKAIRGKIIKCIGYENGFIVYATGNVTRAEYVGGQETFKFTVIEAAEGVTDPRHIAAYKQLHYYWGTKGLSILDPVTKDVKLVLPELADWINKYRLPITLEFLSSRWLVIYLQDRVRRFSNRDVRIGKVELEFAPEYADDSPREIPATKHGANLYPIYQRALIYDTVLQRWGTSDIEVLKLSSMSPINQDGYQIAKDYELTAASLHNLSSELLLTKEQNYDGTPFVRGFNIGFSNGFQDTAGMREARTHIANVFPSISYILFGHYGVSRDRNTKLSQINPEFVDFPNATIGVERSIDGATIEWTESYSAAMTALKATVYPNMVGKWLNILIKGTFHLKRLLIKGQSYGRG